MDQDTDPPEIGRLRDSRSLWRFLGWGTLAAVALTGAVLITQTDAGSQRLQFALAPLTGKPSPAIAQAGIPPNTSVAPQAVPSNDTTKETDALRLETQRLRAEVHQLAADRERLNARIAGLEHRIGDLTGSIKRDLSLIAATAPKSPPPAIAPPATAPPRAEVATAGDNETRPANVGREQDEPQARFESHVDTKPAVGAKSDAKTEQPAKLQASMPVSQTVPLPPVRVASAPANIQPGNRELGIDLGGAHTLEILNARWMAVKANFGPYIDGMHPLMVHDTRPSTKIPYRLIVGPVPNGAAAAQLCQRFAASRVICRTTRFAGEPLAQP